MAAPRERRDWFGTVTGDVAHDPTISVTAKAVYLSLSIWRNQETNECFPSNKTIAAGLGVSERTVIRAIVELEQAGVVHRIPQFRDGRQVNSLTVLTDAKAAWRGGRS